MTLVASRVHAHPDPRRLGVLAIVIIAAAAVAGLVVAVANYLVSGAHGPRCTVRTARPCVADHSDAAQALHTRRDLREPLGPLSVHLFTAWQLDADRARGARGRWRRCTSPVSALACLCSTGGAAGRCGNTVFVPGSDSPSAGFATNGSIAVYDQVLFSAHMARAPRARDGGARPADVRTSVSAAGHGVDRRHRQRAHTSGSLTGRKSLSVLFAPPVALAVYTVPSSSAATSRG